MLYRMHFAHLRLQLYQSFALIHIGRDITSICNSQTSRNCLDERSQAKRCDTKCLCWLNHPFNCQRMLRLKISASLTLSYVNGFIDNNLSVIQASTVSFYSSANAQKSCDVPCLRPVLSCNTGIIYIDSHLVGSSMDCVHLMLTSSFFAP